MSNKPLRGLLILVLGLIVGSTATLLLRPAVVVQGPSAGSAGVDHTQSEYFKDGAYISAFQDLDNTVPTLSASPSVATSTARTLTASEICQNPTVDMAFGNSTGTVTFPTAAQLTASGQCLSKPGSWTTFKVRNASTTSTGFITYAAGASTTIFTARDATISTTTAGHIANFTFTRYTSSSAPWVIITQGTF